MKGLSRWRIAGATARGRGHFLENIPCQDSISFRLNHDVTVIALADGAGSRKHSHIGADTTTRTVCNFLSNSFDSLLSAQGSMAKKQILSAIIHKLDEKSKTLGCERSELASTLLFAAADQEHFLAGHLGDGVIGELSDDSVKLLSEPYNLEFANMTVFTTSPEAFDQLRIYRKRVRGNTGCVLMSDGTSHSLYQKASGIFGNAVKKIFQWFKYYSDKKTSKRIKSALEQVIVPRTFDDCSLVLMKKQSMKMNELLQQDERVQKAFLGVIRTDGLTNRMRILNNAAHENVINDDLFETKISSRTIYRHLRALRQLGLLEG